MRKRKKRVIVVAEDEKPTTCMCSCDCCGEYEVGSWRGNYFYCDDCIDYIIQCEAQLGLVITGNKQRKIEGGKIDGFYKAKSG